MRILFEIIVSYYNNLVKGCLLLIVYITLAQYLVIFKTNKRRARLLGTLGYSLSNPGISKKSQSRDCKPHYLRFRCTMEFPLFFPYTPIYILLQFLKLYSCLKAQSIFHKYFLNIFES